MFEGLIIPQPLCVRYFMCVQCNHDAARCMLCAYVVRATTLQLCFSFSELRLVPALLAHSTVLIIFAVSTAVVSCSLYGG